MPDDCSGLSDVEEEEGEDEEDVSLGGGLVSVAYGRCQFREEP